ncbi:MAG: methylmalonyl-CoA epimerase [Chloroflexota bacterium]
MRLDHVALVVRDLEQVAGFYRRAFGLHVTRRYEFPEQGVRIAFLPGGAGGAELELVQPTDPQTGVARYLESRGEGMHHLCFEVDDLEAELARLAALGVELIDAVPRRGAEGRVAFVHPRGAHGVLIELLQRS